MAFEARSLGVRVFLWAGASAEFAAVFVRCKFDHGLELLSSDMVCPVGFLTLNTCIQRYHQTPGNQWVFIFGISALTWAQEALSRLAVR